MRPLLLFIFLLFSFLAIAQSKMTADTSAYHSISGIVNELPRLITSETGKTKNLEAIEALFLPSARLTIRMHDPAFPSPVESVGLEEFIELLSDPYYEEGFKEVELYRRVEEYNGIAHVLQTFEAWDRDGEHARGITSYQLVFMNGRWWIVSVLWTDDSNGISIPQQYLGN